MNKLQAQKSLERYAAVKVPTVLRSLPALPPLPGNTPRHGFALPMKLYRGRMMSQWTTALAIMGARLTVSAGLWLIFSYRRKVRECIGHPTLSSITAPVRRLRLGALHG